MQDRTDVRDRSAELLQVCEDQGLGDGWKSWKASDAVRALLIFLALTALRLSGAERDGMLFHACYAISIGILVVATFWQEKTSHAMLLTVHSWSLKLIKGQASCKESKDRSEQVKNHDPQLF